MKSFLILVLGLAIGFGSGWFVSQGSYRHFYETTQELQLLGSEAKIMGSLPIGTPMVSDLKLEPAPDLGWWAFVPVYFDTMAEAIEMGVKPRESGIVSVIMEATLRAHLPFEVLYPESSESGPEEPPE